MTRQPIGVMGCLPTMPASFPIDMSENAGNMVHGNAPFEIYPESVFYKDPRFSWSGQKFDKFVNEECSHLIVTVANFFKIGDENNERYARFQRFLEKFDVPIVVFGLGAQAPTSDLSGTLPPAAIDLMKYLGDHSEAVGVRGEFTASVFDHFAGVGNTFVTGCPSFFSRPEAFAKLADAVTTERTGRAAFNGTTYHDPLEKRMLVRAVQEDSHLIEPVNRFTTAYARELQRGVAEPTPPWFLKASIKDGDLSLSQVERYFSSRFHLFRDTASWYTFNEESVGFSFGTRFHVNMASMLSGVPAVWVTHDSRTQELTEYLQVPAITKEEAAELSSDEIHGRMDYSRTFAALDGLFDRFNTYLRRHSLRPIEAPDVRFPATAE